MPSTVPTLFALLTTVALAYAQHISDTTTAQTATAFSLLYGYPLLAFEKLATPLLGTVGVNYIRHARQLSTAADTAVVKPNVDTLYSTAIWDLSQSDVAVTIPEIPTDQFALFSYYDPYGDNFANTGTGNAVNGSGKYLITVPRNGTSRRGVEGTGGEGVHGAYRAVVKSPSAYGILLIRWLINATNVEAVHGYQNGTTIAAVSREGGAVAPQLTSLVGGNGSLSPAENALDLLAEMAVYTGPEVRADEDRVNSTLETAGVGQGTSYGQASGVNLTLANQTALVGAVTAAASAEVSLNNGWSMVASNQTGDFGTNYGLRTAVAASGYLMLKSPNAIYPSWSNGTAGSAVGASSVNVPAEESLLYTFSSKPPLRAGTGFWSLTAYDADGYLVSNTLNVYSLGDRSNLTFPDGAEVYGGNSTKGGEFQILLQAADVVPPANWTSNWLPGPAGGGNVSALLRWYGAEETLLDGSYVYPIVTRQTALRASNGTKGTSTQPPPVTQTSAALKAWAQMSAYTVVIACAVCALISI